MKNTQFTIKLSYIKKNLVYVNLSDSAAKSNRQKNFSICYKESVKKESPKKASVKKPHSVKKENAKKAAEPVVADEVVVVEEVKPESNKKCGA